MNTPLDIATDYTERGWRVVPIPHKKKGPIVGAWQTLRLDTDALAQHFNGRPMNVGVILGDPSGGLIDIDLDCKEAIALADRFLPATEGVFGRESKPRSHRLYVVTGDAPRITKYVDPIKDDGHQQTLLEIRGTGGQTVFPGSMHESGEAIEFDNDQPAKVNAANLADAAGKLAAATLLARHWPGHGGRHDIRLSLSGGLARAGWPLEDVQDFFAAIAFATGDDKQDHRAAIKSTFDNLAADKPSTGWPSVAKQLGTDGDLIVTKLREWLGIQVEAVEVEADEEPQLKPFPDNLLMPPGHVGQLVKWINDTAYKPQPVLSLANALAFWGAVVGRKVSVGKARTNFYALGVGESGSGKEHSRSCVKQLAEMSGIASDILGGEELASDAGLLRAVQRQPTIIFQIDEVGHFFANTSNKYAGSHQRQIAPTFTKLFSQAAQKYLGKEYATADRIEIEQPNVCLYGTTVPGRLYEGLTPGEIGDGFLARMLVFRSDDPDPMETDVELIDPPDELVSAIVKWWNRNDLPRAKGNVAAVTKHEPFQVAVDDDAKARFRELGVLARRRKEELRDGSGLDSLWARAPEHCRKIALILASGCAFEAGDLVITGDLADYACDLTEYLIDRFVDEVRSSVAGSDAERDVQLVQKVIRSAGGQGIDRSKLVRATQRLTRRSREEAIETLMEMRVIGKREATGDERGSRGRAATIYYPAK